jgi:EAL domain-containing protein (putative c-di-GMP-specific phosphodiesterase class I)
VVETANNLLSVLHDALDVGRQRLHVTVSMGLAVMRPEHVRGEDMLRDADAAMFHAKNDGRNRVASFDETMRKRAFRRHELEQALWSAIERNEFQLAFQPKVRISDGTLSGFEALLRWNSVERGPIGPADFIPLAEETGAILPIGLWVIEQACKQLCLWRVRHPGVHVDVAVNLSGRQLHHQEIVAEVDLILKRCGLHPSSLELEITESVVMTNATAAIERLQQLKALGVRLSIDDFGTGYSSLAYLRKLPVDILKIDRAFVAGLGRDPEDLEICRLVITMAKMLGMTTVAEGVETEVHLDELRKLGCTTAQGYLIAKPMYANDAEALFQQLPTRADTRAKADVS